MIVQVVQGTGVERYYPRDSILTINLGESRFSLEMAMLDGSRITRIAISGALTLTRRNDAEKKLEVELG